MARVQRVVEVVSRAVIGAAGGVGAGGGVGAVVWKEAFSGV